MLELKDVDCVRDGKLLLAAGDAPDVLTTQLVSAAFNHPIQIRRTNGRWTARTHREA